MTEKTYVFKELYIETITRNPQKVGLSGFSRAYKGLGWVPAGIVEATDAPNKPKPTINPQTPQTPNSPDSSKP